jgi:PAS domain S-box-containing protein
MDGMTNDRIDEIKRLQRCISDLVSVLALPAMWSGGEPSQIVQTMLDALLHMLQLDFAYVWLKDSGAQAAIEMVRSARPQNQNVPLEIGDALKRRLGTTPQEWPSLLSIPLGEREISVVPLALGLQSEIGVLFAGCERADFPQQTERLILSVAANQAAIALQEARLLSQQRRVASELDLRVAQRTRELAEANNELQLQVGLLQHLPVSAWTLKPDGTPDFVNRVWLEYSGQTLDFVRSHPEAWMNAIHPDDRESASKSFWGGVRSGQGFAMETRSLRAHDGTYRWHLNQAVVLRDGEGRVLRFVGTTTDIDDQKRAQDALRASENDLRKILEGIPGFVCTLSADGQVELPNRRLLEFFGKTLEEVNSWSTNDLVHPDDLPRVTAEITHSFTTGTLYDSELRYRRADGVYRWFQVRILPVRDTEGRLTRWYGLITDIEDRKCAEDELRRSEAGYRVVIEAASDAVISMDESGDILLANPATKRIFGFDPLELVGKPMTVLMPEVMRKLHENGLKRYLATGKRHLNWQGVEVTAQRKDGEEFPAEVSFGELTRDGHKVFTGFIRDVSERKRAEDQLRASERNLQMTQAELARVSRLTTMGELAASIAHEVNQPLTAVINNGSACLRLLANQNLEPEVLRRALEGIVADGNRAGAVLARIRAFIKKEPAVTISLDINEVIQEVLVLSGEQLSENQVSIECQLTANLPLLLGDRVQLQQVLLNLIMNGIEAMTAVPDRPRSLFVQSRYDESGNVLVAISDSGRGFGSEMDRVFTPFYTTKANGIGMGLSISRSIIEGFGGRLWAVPNSPHGAVFSFALPITDGSHS